MAMFSAFDINATGMTAERFRMPILPGRRMVHRTAEKW